MAFGFEIYGSTGNLLVSGDSIPASVADVFVVTAGSSGSTSYPEMVNHILSVTTVSATIIFDFSGGSGSTKQRRATATITYPSGVPTVSWSYTTVTGDDVYVDTIFYVFSS